MPSYSVRRFEKDGIDRALPVSISGNSCLDITQEAWISEETDGIIRKEHPSFDPQEPRSHLAQEFPELYRDIRRAVRLNQAEEIFSLHADDDKQREGGPRTSVMNYLIMNEGLRSDGWAIAESPKKEGLTKRLGYSPGEKGVLNKNQCVFRHRDVKVEVDARKEGCLAEIQFGNSANMKENVAYQFQLASCAEPTAIDAAVMIVPSSEFSRYVSHNTANFDNTSKYLGACWDLADSDYRVGTTVLGMGFEESDQAQLEDY